MSANVVLVKNISGGWHAPEARRACCEILDWMRSCQRCPSLTRRVVIGKKSILSAPEPRERGRGPRGGRCDRFGSPKRKVRAPQSRMVDNIDRPQG